MGKEKKSASNNTEALEKPNFIRNRMEKVSEVKVTPIKYGMDDFISAGKLNQITIHSCLRPTDYDIKKLSTDMEDEWQNTLSELIMNNQIRSEVYKFLSDRELIREVFNNALMASSGLVRLGSALTNYVLVSQAVKQLVNQGSHSGMAISIILCQALKTWGLLGVNIPIASFSILQHSDLDLVAIKSELQRDAARAAVQDLKIFPISPFIDRVSSTNTAAMADTLVMSTERFRWAIQGMFKIDNALDAVIPRIRAFVTKTIDENYKDASERASFDSGMFLDLATNLTLIQVALNQDLNRPTVPPYLWSEYDAILREAIYNARRYKVVQLNTIADEFAFTKVADAHKRLKYTVITRLIRSTQSIKSYWSTECGGYSEYTEYDRLNGITDSVAAWMNSISSLDVHNYVCGFLTRAAASNIDPHLVELGVLSDTEKTMIAAALSNAVYYSAETNGLVYSLSGETYVDADYIIDGFTDDLLVSNVDVVLMVASRSVIGGTWAEYAKNLSFQPGERYMSIAPYVNTGVETSRQLVIEFAESYMSSEFSRYIEEVNILDLFSLDKTFKIVTQLPLASYAIGRLLVNSYAALQKHVADAYTGQKQVESGLRGSTIQFVGSRLRNLIESPEMAVLSRSIRYRIRRNKTLFDRPISDASLMTNRLIVDLASVGLVCYILEVMAYSQTGTTDDEYTQFSTLSDMIRRLGANYFMEFK